MRFLPTLLLVLLLTPRLHADLIWNYESVPGPHAPDGSTFGTTMSGQLTTTGELSDLLVPNTFQLTSIDSLDGMTNPSEWLSGAAPPFTHAIGSISWMPGGPATITGDFLSASSPDTPFGPNFIVLATPGTSSYSQFGWFATGPGSFGAYFQPQRTAFTLISTVPEPSSGLWILSAILVARFRARRT